MYKGNHNESKASTSRETGQQSESNIQSKIQNNHCRVLIILINRLAISKVADAFERVRLIPLKQLYIKKRMNKVVQNVFKRQDYLGKWEGFQNIKRAALASEKLQYQKLKDILKIQRGTAIRLLTHFMLGKKRDILHSMLRRVKERADINIQKTNVNMRRAFRNISRIFTSKISSAFFKIKDSRVIIVSKKRLWNTVRILKEIRTQHMRWAFVLMRREMVRDRQDKVKEEIEQLDEKLKVEEDEELTMLQNRHKQLNEQLQTVKKEKEEIQIKLDEEVKLVEVKQKQMDDHLEGLKKQQEEMRKKIDQIDEELQEPFSLEEIYQLCYQNLLWTVSENPSKDFTKEELLKSLEVPLVPIDLPLQELKEQNQVLKDLLSEYILMYGEKKLPVGSKIQLPYEYLLKENNLLYKMLKTLLPQDQFLREELHKIRETYENVQEMIKECTSK